MYTIKHLNKAIKQMKKMTGINIIKAQLVDLKRLSLQPAVGVNQLETSRFHYST